MKEQTNVDSTNTADVLIIGAGVAGLATAHKLRKQGHSVLVLEASDRIGGRAHTVEDQLSTPLDLGARWLHNGENNPFVPIARKLGFTLESMGRDHYAQGKHWLSSKEAKEPTEHVEASWKMIGMAGRRFRDTYASRVLKGNNRWRGLFQYICSTQTGMDVAELSTQDICRYEESGSNYFVMGGLGKLIQQWASDLPIQLEQPVEKISWHSSGVMVKSASREFHGKKVALTCSVGALQSGHITFSPEMPDWKKESFQKLTMGHLEMIAIEFSEDFLELEPNSNLYIQNASGTCIGFSIKPGGQQVVYGCIGGRQSQSLLAQGENALVEFGLKQLERAYGKDLREYVIATSQTAWGQDKWANGALSAALLDGTKQREKLAQQIEQTLFFAGEATSVSGFGSIHGAFASGARCAEEIHNTLQQNMT